MKLKRYGILNDVHFPFEDKQRYEFALETFRRSKIDHLYLNGDIGEFLSVSSHPKPPDEQLGLMAEIAYMNKRFDEICGLFPDVPVTLIEGNHCYRFFRYIRDVAPQMWGLIDCPKLLKFDERPKWKFVPYGPEQLHKCGQANLYLRHEPLAGGANHAGSTAAKSLVDIAYGHTHQYQVGAHRKFGPKPVTTRAYSLGWMGDRKHSVFDYRGSRDNWVAGFTLVEAEESGDYTLEFIERTK